MNLRLVAPIAFLLVGLAGCIESNEAIPATGAPLPATTLFSFVNSESSIDIQIDRVEILGADGHPAAGYNMQIAWPESASNGLPPLAIFTLDSCRKPVAFTSNGVSLYGRQAFLQVPILLAMEGLDSLTTLNTSIPGYTMRIAPNQDGTESRAFYAGELGPVAIGQKWEFRAFNGHIPTIISSADQTWKLADPSPPYDLDDCDEKPLTRSPPTATRSAWGPRPEPALTRSLDAVVSWIRNDETLVQAQRQIDQDGYLLSWSYHAEGDAVGPYWSVIIAAPAQSDAVSVNCRPISAAIYRCSELEVALGAPAPLPPDGADQYALDVWVDLLYDGQLNMVSSFGERWTGTSVVGALTGSGGIDSAVGHADIDLSVGRLLATSE